MISARRRYASEQPPLAAALSESQTAQRAPARCECAQHTGFLMKLFNQESVLAENRASPDEAEDAGGLTLGKDDNEVWRNSAPQIMPFLCLTEH